MPARTSILYVPLEFSTWEMARPHSYGVQLALEEGFEAAGVEYLTVPAVCDRSQAEAPAGSISPWIRRMREVCRGRKFDQVWIELVHSNFDQDFLNFISETAPVRIGLMGESIHYAEEVYQAHPVLRDREAVIKNRLRYLTHALFCDELDAEDVRREFPHIKTGLWNSPVPGRLLHTNFGTPKIPLGLFMGSVYGARGAWLEHPALQGLLTRGESAESRTEYPALFDKLQSECAKHLVGPAAVDAAQLPGLLAAYTGNLRAVRRACFDLYCRKLSEGTVIVNLPQFGSLYAGRVIEAIAVGRPVITPQVQGRPRTQAIFEAGREILHYRYPEELAQLLKLVICEPALAANLAERAKAKVAQSMTAEAFVARVLQWVAS